MQIQRSASKSARRRRNRSPLINFLRATWGMLDNEKLQLAGPIGVIVALVCAECWRPRLGVLAVVVAALVP